MSWNDSALPVCEWLKPTTDNATVEEEGWRGYDAASKVINGPLTLVLCLLGLGGTGWGVRWVSGRLRVRRTLAFHSVLLGLWDCGVLISAVCYYSLRSFLTRYNIVSDSAAFDMLTLGFHPVTAVCLAGSVWSVVVITTERHSALWKPIEFRAMDNIFRARRIGAAVLLAAKNSSCLPPASPAPISFLDPAPLRRHPLYIFLYRLALHTATTSLGPFLAILVLSLRMIGYVVQSVREIKYLLPFPSRDATIRSRRKTEFLITSMLLGLAVKFLLTHTLPTLLNFWETVLQIQGQRQGPSFYLAVEISNLLVVVNSATNWLVYFHCLRRKPTGRASVRLREKKHFRVRVPLLFKPKFNL